MGQIEEALISYSVSAGRCQSAWRFADADVCETVGMALISDAWSTFLRDAGAGDVGQAHRRTVGTEMLLCAGEDPRRDMLLLWLAEHSAGPLRSSAKNLVLAVDAKRPFGTDARDLIEAAHDGLREHAMPMGPIARALGMSVNYGRTLGELARLAGALDRLRADPAFSEAPGTEVRHAMPRGTFAHFVPAEPGAAWACNLALLDKESAFSNLPAAGLVSRALFRHDLETERVAEMLVEGAASALSATESLFKQTFSEIARGRAALAHLSRNARAFRAWKIVVAMRTISRSQLARALGLSRGGADIQARVLADAGLVDLGDNGRIVWRRRQARPEAVSRPPPAGLREAAAEVDASLAEIDRLLARSQ